MPAQHLYSLCGEPHVDLLWQEFPQCTLHKLHVFFEPGRRLEELTARWQFAEVIVWMPSGPVTFQYQGHQRGQPIVILRASTSQGSNPQAWTGLSPQCTRAQANDFLLARLSQPLTGCKRRVQDIIVTGWWLDAQAELPAGNALRLGQKAIHHAPFQGHQCGLLEAWRAAGRRSFGLSKGEGEALGSVPSSPSHFVPKGWSEIVHCIKEAPRCQVSNLLMHEVFYKLQDS